MRTVPQGKFREVRPIIRLWFILGLLAVHLAHPFLHQFEGGTLDMLMMHVDAFAAKLTSEP